jgi:hypothetical protein
MDHYKNFPIRTTAISTEGGLWHARGVVLDPREKLLREIHRIDTAKDLVFLSKQQAEEFALKLCKAWIDRSAIPRAQ